MWPFGTNQTSAAEHLGHTHCTAGAYSEQELSNLFDSTFIPALRLIQDAGASQSTSHDTGGPGLHNATPTPSADPLGGASGSQPKAKKERRGEHVVYHVNPDNYPQVMEEFRDLVLEGLKEEGKSSEQIAALRRQHDMWTALHAEARSGQLRSRKAQKLLLGSTKRNTRFVKEGEQYTELPDPTHLGAKAAVVGYLRLSQPRLPPPEASQQLATGYPSVLNEAGDFAVNLATQTAQFALDEFQAAREAALFGNCEDRDNRESCVGVFSKMENRTVNARGQKIRDDALKGALNHTSWLGQLFQTPMNITIVHLTRNATAMATQMLGSQSTKIKGFSDYLTQKMPHQFPAQPVGNATEPAASTTEPAGSATTTEGGPATTLLDSMVTLAGSALTATRTTLSNGASAAANGAGSVLNGMANMFTLPGADASTLTTRPPSNTTASPAAGPSDTVYLRLLSSILDGWIDYGKARAQRDKPLALLQGVFQHHGRNLPKAFETGFNVTLLEDEGWFDEAALLHHKLQNQAADDAEDTVPPSLAYLQQRFQNALRAESQSKQAHANLMRPSAAAAGAPQFDGFSIRNAFNQTFDEVLAMPDLWRDPVHANVGIDKKREMLKARFAELGESTQYKIGTAQQSLASTLIRIAKYRGQPVPADFENDEALLLALKEVEDAWVADRSTFPIHPRLLFSMHLANASGVDIMSTAQRFEQFRSILQRGFEGASQHPQRDYRTFAWMVDVGKKWNDGQTWWMFRNDSIRRQALAACFEALRAETGHRRPPEGTGHERIWQVAQWAKQNNLLGEVLLGDTTNEKLAAALQYGSERLQAAIGGPPKFDRETAAFEILKRYGLSDEEALRLVPAFMERLGAPDFVGTMLRLNPGRVIKPYTELLHAELLFNDGLPNDPRVRAVALENLRVQGVVPTEEKVTAEINRIVPGLNTDLESTRSRSRMLDRTLVFIPFVGSVREVYSGWSDGDRSRLVLGLLSGAMEGVNLRQLNMMRVAMNQRQGLQDFVKIANKLDLTSPVTVSDLPADPLEVVGGPPAVAASVAARDGNVPPAFRRLAQRVRNGERGVLWQGHELVMLTNEEDRVVPVRNIGGAYQEIDWQTGHAVGTGRIIHYDSATQKFHSDLQLNGGVRPTVEVPVDYHGTPIAERQTVVDVMRSLAPATDASVRDIDAILNRRFTFQEQNNALREWASEGINGMQGLKNFLKRMYERSYTFRRMLNYYDDTAGDKRWDLRFGVPGLNGKVVESPVQYPRTSHIEFPHAGVYDTFTSVGGTGLFTKENMVIHELMHALTGWRDPGRNQPHLGGPSWAADKMLHEAGFTVRNRLLYLNLAGGDNDARRPHLIQDMNAENIMLDEVMDRYRAPPIDGTMLEDIPLSQRVTVEQWRQLEDQLQRPPDVTVDQCWSKLQGQFDFGLDNVGDVSPQLREVKRITQRFLKSKTFRSLVETMRVRAAGAWKFEFDPAVAQEELGNAKSSTGASPMHGKIYLYDAQTSYLAADGLHPTEYARKVLLGYINAMTDLSMKAKNPFRNMGGAVKLANRILHESGFHYPEQLVAARAASDADAQRLLLDYITAARRNAALESAYLHRPN
ncbi:hypothetical protein [Pseudoduganella sp. R-43]|uniref:hypothetical protein n=1 Tax=Pseudoduganella sp. R-43 TaxID=3404063 RepID=UPI003CF70831